MDVTAFSEGKYITKELVKSSTSKIATILNEGTQVNGNFGAQLQFEVEIDQRPKLWNPTQDHVKELMKAFGSDSTKWRSKQVAFVVVSVGSGKEKLVAMPKL